MKTSLVGLNIWGYTWLMTISKTWHGRLWFVIYGIYNSEGNFTLKHQPILNAILCIFWSPRCSPLHISAVDNLKRFLVTFHTNILLSPTHTHEHKHKYNQKAKITWGMQSPPTIINIWPITSIRSDHFTHRLHLGKQSRAITVFQPSSQITVLMQLQLTAHFNGIYFLTFTLFSWLAHRQRCQPKSQVLEMTKLL